MTIARRALHFINTSLKSKRFQSYLQLHILSVIHKCCLKEFKGEFKSKLAAKLKKKIDYKYQVKSNL